MHRTTIPCMNENLQTDPQNDNPSEPISISLKELITKMVLNGLTMAEVRDELAERGITISYARVWQIAHKNVIVRNDVLGAKAFYKGRPRRQVVMELYDGGKGPKAISDILGIPYQYVCAHIAYTKRKRLEQEAKDRTPSVERQPFSPKLQERVDY